MILNKLKINDAKTEFIVFRSPMLKHDLSDLSVNVGGHVIKPSEKVCDLDHLGVILDQTLSFDDHISTICQSAHFHIRNTVDAKEVLTLLKRRKTFTAKQGIKFHIPLSLLSVGRV